MTALRPLLALACHAIERAHQVDALDRRLADGNGEIAIMFKNGVPDLTGIAKRNDGVFPLLAVIQTIDGRSMIRGHGNPMPVFGNRYRAEADGGDTIFGAEAIARGRVLELALYLQSIQQ